MLGYTQAFSSFGGLLVASANVTAAQLAASLPAIHGGHEAWRYTLISGIIPALPLIVIRPFLPESPEWAAQAEGRTAQAARASRSCSARSWHARRSSRRWSSRRSYGIAFGAIQQLPQILGAPNRGHVAVLAESPARRAQQAVAAAQAAGQPAPPEPRLRQIAGNATDQAVARVSFWQEMGGLAGRFVLAMLARGDRQPAHAAAHLPDPGADLRAAALLVDRRHARRRVDSLPWIKVGIFVAGFFTVAQFSFWGNYIPLVFPLHLRGTGESFAANIGGRVIGTAAAWFTLTFSESRPPDPAKIAIVGAIVAGVYALVGAMLTQWLPEPPSDAVAKEGR